MSRLPFSILFNLLIDNVPDSEGNKYSLGGLSREIGISVNQLSLYKRGNHNNPTIENAMAILDFFSMPIAYLDCNNKVDAMKMIVSIHGSNEKPPTLPPVRFRNPEGLTISDEAMYQVKELLSWVFAREEALKNGDPEPPLPDFRD